MANTAAGKADEKLTRKRLKLPPKRKEKMEGGNKKKQVEALEKIIVKEEIVKKKPLKRNKNKQRNKKKRSIKKQQRKHL